MQGRHRCRLLLIFAAIAGGLLTGLGIAAQPLDSPTEQVESQNAQPVLTPTVVKTPPRVDLKHPQDPIDGVYPEASKQKKEEGRCFVSLMVDTGGSIRALQLLTSTGFEHLDAACLMSAAVNAHLLPATLNGKPVVGWTTFPVDFSLTPHKMSTKITLVPDSAAPRMADNYELQVGPNFYPASSRESHQQGDCIVYLKVAESGVVADARVLKSTGFRALDQACLDAATHAEFTPKNEDGRAVAAWTYIAMFWRLR